MKSGHSKFNKSVGTVILLSIILGVYGAIAYRLKSTDISKEVGPTTELVEKNTANSNDSMDIARQKVVNFSFKDPFKELADIHRTKELGSSQKISANSKIQSNKNNSKNSTQAQRSWPLINYMGSMKNHSTGDLRVTISLNKEIYILQSGDFFAGIEVVEAHSDSLVCRLDNEVKTIYKRNP